MSEKMTTPPANNESPCPECGEMVRPGLVRCWNCGGFMKRELEQKYLEMQAAPKKVYLSQLPDEVAALTEAGEVVGSIADDELDFEADDDYVLSAPVQVASPVVTQSSSPSSSYSLKDAPSADEPAAESRADKSSAEADAENAGVPAGRGSREDRGGVAHSVATGGDALLDIAMNEEAEGKKRRRRLTGPIRTANGFIIFCPYGCRVEVKEQHRGMSGKCPKCRAPFIVPVDPPDYEHARAREKSVAETAETTAAPGGFVAWMHDLHVHTVNPTRLKLKADSLAKEFAPFEFGFADGKLLMLSLAAKKGGGMFGAKKKDAGGPLDGVFAHLREGKPIADLPVGEKHLWTVDQAREMRVVWPESSRAASAFHGVPVFGKNVIAVQLPLDDSVDTRYVSLTISQFREFNQHLEQVTGMDGLAANVAVPLTDEFTVAKCHYTDAPVKALKDVDWYLADTARPVVVGGYKCEGCGLVVSEAGRKKEKLGGANGKGIAKAPCPKCKKKFGNHPLYTLPEGADAGMDGDVASKD